MRQLRNIFKLCLICCVLAFVGCSDEEFDRIVNSDSLSGSEEIGGGKTSQSQGWCKSCGGTGYVKSDKQDVDICPVCHGTGTAK